jgi:hypothetical protein
MNDRRLAVPAFGGRTSEIGANVDWQLSYRVELVGMSRYDLTDFEWRVIEPLLCFIRNGRALLIAQGELSQRALPGVARRGEVCEGYAGDPRRRDRRPG